MRKLQEYLYNLKNTFKGKSCVCMCVHCLYIFYPEHTHTHTHTHTCPYTQTEIVSSIMLRIISTEN